MLGVRPSSWVALLTLCPWPFLFELFSQRHEGEDAARKKKRRRGDQWPIRVPLLPPPIADTPDDVQRLCARHRRCAGRVVAAGPSVADLMRL